MRPAWRTCRVKEAAVAVAWGLEGGSSVGTATACTRHAALVCVCGLPWPCGHTEGGHAKSIHNKLQHTKTTSTTRRTPSLLCLYCPENPPFTAPAVQHPFGILRPRASHPLRPLRLLCPTAANMGSLVAGWDAERPGVPKGARRRRVGRGGWRAPPPTHHKPAPTRSPHRAPSPPGDGARAELQDTFEAESPGYFAKLRQRQLSR